MQLGLVEVPVLLEPESHVLTAKEHLTGRLVATYGV